MSNNPYVFISYAHKDSATVLPCVNALKNNNINLWYDEGIQAGSEWPEYIAEKVMYCEKFVLFISKAYLESQNCKRELNFAISRKKDILSIFIEDVQLSPGMEMQLGTYQSIFKNRFADVNAFHASVCGEHWFDSCRIQKAAPVPPKPQTVPQPKPQPIPTPIPTPMPQPKQKPVKLKNRVVAALLAIFLGSFGAQRFYLGRPLLGVLCIVCFWTYLPSIIGFIEGIIILCMSDEKFEQKYKCRVK